MIITDKFVLINYPKTGTTFVCSTLKSMHGWKDTIYRRLMRKFGLYHTPIRELLLPKLYGDYPLSVKDKHGAYRQIPTSDIGKTVVSIVRNPLTRYISSYVYEWWKHTPPFPMTEVKKAFPGFPNISFIEFYQLLNHPLVNEDKLRNPKARILGSYTRMFLVFYSQDPEEAAKELLEGRLLSDILPPIVFLHQEYLRDELSSFLEDMGYSAEKITQVYKTGDKNVGSDSKKKEIPQEELTEVATAILKDDKALFDAFPEYYEEVVAISEGSELNRIKTNGFIGPRKLGY